MTQDGLVPIQTQLEERIAHLTRVLRAIREVNQIIIKERDRGTILNRVCDVLVDTQGYEDAWFVTIRDVGNCIGKVYRASTGNAFDPLIKGLRQGKTYPCIEKTLSSSSVVVVSREKDTWAGCPFDWLHEKYGVMSVRIEQSENNYGVLAVAFNYNLFLGEEEQSLFKELADNIGLALHTLEEEDERQKAEDALRSERDKAQMYLDLAGVMMVAIDANEHIVMMNRKGCEILGYREDEILGMNWFDTCLPEKGRSEVKRVFHEIISGKAGLVHYYQNPVLTRKGELRLMAWTNTFIKDQEGRIIATMSSGEDITERANAESLLTESEEKYRYIVDNTGLTIAHVGADGKYLFLNKAALVLLQRRPEEIIGKRAVDELPEKYANIHKKNWERVMATKESVLDTVCYDTPKGPLWFSSLLQPIKDPNGNITSVIIIGQDITAQKLSEVREQRMTEMEQATKMKDMFLANMSHELRTPLNAVIGYSEILSDELFGNLNEKQKEHLDRILASSKHLLALISDMLDLTKIEAGMLELHKAPFDIRLTIKDIRDICNEHIRQKAHSVRLEVPDELPYMFSDETRVKQVMMNLLMNAIKYTPNGGTIHISVDNDEKEFKISVKDNGPGLTKEETEKVFDLFWQKDSTLSRTQGGVGLGLPISKRIVNRLGGRIRFESELGKGTNVWFTIPIEKHENDR